VKNDSGHSAVPVWLLGSYNFPLEAYFAVMLLTMPRLLAANDVPEQQIAGITAVGFVWDQTGKARARGPWEGDVPAY
jgi:hypothetical protein